jgi:hypothetical protein
MYLSEFDFKVERINGKDNIFADVLTRPPVCPKNDSLEVNMFDILM